MGTALIIEDEEDLGLLLKNYLEKKNFEVYLSQTLQDADSLLNQIHPNVIFIDNNLPDGFGWNKAALLASQNPNTYFFLMSGFHPTPPEMPKDSKYKVMEKPLSYKQLDYLIVSFV